MGPTRKESVRLGVPSTSISTRIHLEDTYHTVKLTTEDEHIYKEGRSVCGLSVIMGRTCLGSNGTWKSGTSNYSRPTRLGLERLEEGVETDITTPGSYMMSRRTTSSI